MQVIDKLETFNTANDTIERFNRYMRTYGTEVNNKFYEIEKIYIFNEQGIIATFNYHYDLLEKFKSDQYKTEKPIKLKRKIDYSKNQNFIISKGKNINDELTCDIYIHESEFKEINKSHNTTKEDSTTYFYDVFEITSIDDITITIKVMKKYEVDYKQKLKDKINKLDKVIGKYEDMKEVTEITLIEFENDLKTYYLF